MKNKLLKIGLFNAGSLGIRHDEFIAALEDSQVDIMAINETTPYTNVEQMWLSFTVNTQKIMIGTAYRPPWVDVDIFLDALTSSIVSFTRADKIILVGDFNINLLKTNDSKTKLFFSFLNYTRLSQIISEPTH